MMCHSLSFPGSKAPTIFFKGSAANRVPMNNHEELDSDMLKRCGSLLRNCFLKQDFELNDRFCDANDLEKAYRDIVIPDKVADVFSALFDFDVKSKYPTRSEDSLETEL